MIPKRVRIVEVGPRDGLQNEAVPVPVEARIAFIEALADAGLQTIEAGRQLRLSQMGAANGRHCRGLARAEVPGRGSLPGFGAEHDRVRRRPGRRCEAGLGGCCLMQLAQTETSRPKTYIYMLTGLRRDYWGGSAAGRGRRAGRSISVALGRIPGSKLAALQEAKGP